MKQIRRKRSLMSWKETCAVEQRLEFIKRAGEEEESIAELCREFGVSRKTGYTWLHRYEQEGLEGLRDQSRAPLRQANATSAEQVRAVLTARGGSTVFGGRRNCGYG